MNERMGIINQRNSIQNEIGEPSFNLGNSLEKQRTLQARTIESAQDVAKINLPIQNETISIEDDLSNIENQMNEQFPGFLGVETKEELTPVEESSVATKENLDNLFGTLSSDIEGANSYLSKFMEERNTLTKTGKILNEFKNNLEKEKLDFDSLVESQRKEINQKRSEIDEYVTNQKARLALEEKEFNEEVEVKRTKLELLEQSLNLTKDQLTLEKEQFAEYKKLEEEKMKNEKAKFETEKIETKKEQENTEKRLEAMQKELDSKIQQFTKYKEVEEKKLEIENKNLTQSCARFKNLVSKFKENFSQINEEK